MSTDLPNYDTPNYDIPPGKALGCLPRRYKVGQVCPLFKERFKVYSMAECDAYIGKVTLEPFIKVVLDQDGVGSCATESTTGGVMIMRASQGLPHVLLNPWFIYHTTSHGRDQGSSIDENLEFARNVGIAPESIWPRSKGWQAKPSAEAVEAASKYRIEEFFDITTLEEGATALVMGYPLIYGSKGHSVLKFKHTKGWIKNDLNSWDVSWGDQGKGTWATDREINWSYGAYAIRLVRQD